MYDNKRHVWVGSLPHAQLSMTKTPHDAHLRSQQAALVSRYVEWNADCLVGERAISNYVVAADLPRERNMQHFPGVQKEGTGVRTTQVYKREELRMRRLNSKIAAGHCAFASGNRLVVGGMPIEKAGSCTSELIIVLYMVDTEPLA